MFHERGRLRLVFSHILLELVGGSEVETEIEFDF